MSKSSPMWEGCGCPIKRKGCCYVYDEPAKRLIAHHRVFGSEVASAYVLELGIGLTRVKPRYAAKKRFRSNAVSLSSMKYAARPILWASTLRAFPFLCLRLSRWART